ncbi:MAG TPA: metallophosphoesterase [Clostridia bacterium]
MKIMLFSDSHGIMNNMVRMLSKHKDVDLVIHLGDLVKDALKLKESFQRIPFEIISGNNDWNREYPSEKTIEAEGKKIFITHGHNYNVKYDYQRIISRGRSANVDAVFFGHTHEPEEMFSDGMMVLNPGSIALPRPPYKPSCCLIEIMDGKIVSRFLGLG